MAFSVPSPLGGTLGRRLSLSFGTVVAFIAVDVLLVTACLFALRQNVRLRSDVASAYALLAPAKGAKLPALAGEDWTGAPKVITYEQDPRRTLVYTFSKNCASCQENWRAMRSLQVLAAERLRIVYVDTVDERFTTEYLAESGIGQSLLLVRLSPSAEVAYHARAVPQLVLVDEAGLVQWSHVGDLDPADISMALSLIGRR